MFNDDKISLKDMYYLMKDGKHNIGWETWEGKPAFAFQFYWYDLPRFCFILGKFHWYVDYD